MLERVAFHEAGHVVAMRELAFKFAFVMIVPEGNKSGYVTSPCPDPSHPRFDRIDRKRSANEREIILTLAGPYAEMRCCGQRACLFEVQGRPGGRFEYDGERDSRETGSSSLCAASRNPQPRLEECA